MQNIIINVKGGTALGTCVDSYAVKTVTPPELVIGCEYMLRLRMFDAEGNAMAPETFDNIGAWEFVMDDDYDAETTPKIVADNTQISVSGVTLPAGTVAEIAIPISATNTVEAAEWLGDAETKRINCELTGMAAGETKPSFVLQISGLAIRNRISSAGTPEPVGEQYYTAVQVEALVAGRTTPAQAEAIAAEAIAEALASGGYTTDEDVSQLIEEAVDNLPPRTVDYNPILAAGCGAYNNLRRVWLDDNADTMNFFDEQYNVSKVVLRLVSANTAVTGNMVLIPIIGGVDQTAVVLPVTATVSAVEIVLSGVNASLGFRRDYSDSRDTLKDGTPIAAVIVAWEVHHG